MVCSLVELDLLLCTVDVQGLAGYQVFGPGALTPYGQGSPGVVVFTLFKVRQDARG